MVASGFTVPFLGFMWVVFGGYPLTPKEFDREKIEWLPQVSQSRF